MLKAFQKAMKAGRTATEDELKKVDKKAAEFEELLNNIEAQRLKQLELEDAMKKSADPELELKKEQEKKAIEEKKIQIQKEFEERKNKLKTMFAEEKERTDPKNQLLEYFKSKGDIGTKSERAPSEPENKTQNESLAQLPSVSNIVLVKDATSKGQKTYHVPNSQPKKLGSTNDLKAPAGNGLMNKSMQSKPAQASSSQTPKYSQSNAVSLVDFAKAQNPVEKVVLPKAKEDKKPQQKFVSIKDVAEPNSYHLQNGSPTLRPIAKHTNKPSLVIDSRNIIDTSAHLAVAHQPKVDMANYSANFEVKDNSAIIMNNKLKPNSPILMAGRQVESPQKAQKARLQISASELSSPILMSDSLKLTSGVRKSQQINTTVESMMTVTNYNAAKKISDNLATSKTEFRITKRTTDDSNRNNLVKKTSPVLISHHTRDEMFSRHVNRSLGDSISPTKNLISPTKTFKTPAKAHRNNVMEFHLNEMKRSLTKEYKASESVMQIKGSQTTKHISSTKNVQNNSQFKEKTPQIRSAKQAPVTHESSSKQSYTIMNNGYSYKVANQANTTIRQPSGNVKSKRNEILELNGLVISSIAKEKKSWGLDQGGRTQTQKRLKVRPQRGFVSRMVREQQIADHNAMTRDGFYSRESHSLPQQRELARNFNPSLTAIGFNAAKTNVDSIFRQANANRTTPMSNPAYRDKVDLKGFWDANMKESSSPFKNQRLKASNRKGRSKLTKEDLIQEIYLLK